MKYIETVRDLSARGGLAYKIIDENFRYLKQAQPSMAWDITHTELWMRASMFTNYSRPPPFRNQTNQSFRKQGNICF